MNDYAYNGNISAIISFLLGGTTFVIGEGFEHMLKIIVMLGSIITAIMAVTYYYYAIREKKKSIEVLISEEKEKNDKESI